MSGIDYEIGLTQAGGFKKGASYTLEMEGRMQLKGSQLQPKYLSKAFVPLLGIFFGEVIRVEYVSHPHSSPRTKIKIGRGGGGGGGGGRWGRGGGGQGGRHDNVSSLRRGALILVCGLEFGWTTSPARGAARRPGRGPCIST